MKNSHTRSLRLQRGIRTIGGASCSKPMKSGPDSGPLPTRHRPSRLLFEERQMTTLAVSKICLDRDGNVAKVYWSVVDLASNQAVMVG